MTYSKTISDLYSGDLTRIINVLNNSTYASSIDKNEEGILVVHTGFVFNTHKGSPIEILYDFKSERVIRQPRKENFSTVLPLINGIWVKGTGDYFGSFMQFIFPEIDSKNNFPKIIGKQNPEIVRLELVNPLQYSQNSNITEIEVKNFSKKILTGIKVINDTDAIEYRFQRRLTETIFADGNKFKRNISDEELQDYKEKQSFDNGSNYEDWLKEEYGDDAETAYWNNE